MPPLSALTAARRSPFRRFLKQPSGTITKQLVRPCFPALAMSSPQHATAPPTDRYRPRRACRPTGTSIMKAYILDHYKQPALRLGDIPTPEMEDDDVLVEVHAAGLNLLDSKIRTGEFK